MTTDELTAIAKQLGLHPIEVNYILPTNTDNINEFAVEIRVAKENISAFLE